MRVWTFGDSITYGQNVFGTGPDYYPFMIALAKKYSISNLAQDGAMAADQYMPVGNATPIDGDIITMLLGPNDERVYGSDAGKQANYGNFIASEAYYLTQNVSKAESWLASGDWRPVPGQLIGYYSGVVGSTLTTSFTGDLLTFGYIIDSSVSGAFSVYVDGINKGTFNTFSPSAIMTSLGVGSGPALGRITGCGAGAHTVTFVMTQPGYIYLDWVGLGPRNTPLFISTIPRMTAAGYAAYGGSDANVASYNMTIGALVKQMIGDGLPANLVDAGGCIDPVTDIGPDGLHPNPQGHINIASAFLRAMG